jgi:hypothetical protein
MTRKPQPMFEDGKSGFVANLYSKENVSIGNRTMDWENSKLKQIVGGFDKGNGV